tara:strand:- start:668 stop:856 length:189 start_codon:yes stop_codon:yes gene_type:complete
MSEELQQRTESLRRMVETRDLTIKDLEREIRELREAINGTPVPEVDWTRTIIVPCPTDHQNL